MIKFGQRSIDAMKGLHPDLIKVLNQAAETCPPENDFTVLEGVRSREQMMINYGKGRSAAELAKFGIPASYAQPGAKKVTWLNNPFASNHAVQKDGYGHAFDIVPYPIDWNDIDKFKALSKIIKAAAEIVGVKLVWGGDWTSSKDYPHYELVQ